MMNATSNDVIIHMVMEPAKVRMKSGDQNVLVAASRGFCWAEFNDGETVAISHPLEEWFLGLINRSSQVGNVYFTIDPPGELSNDGLDDKGTSVNNIQCHLAT